MGKGEEQNLPLQQRREVALTGDSSGFLCGQCSIAFHRVCKELNFKCFFVLVLGFVVFVPGFFWLLPLHERNSGFEAKDNIKLSATVQVYFVLEKPVTELLPHIKRLEFDINGELDIPNVKVSILSMHDIGESNRTYVVFGLLSEYITAPINPVSLSLLRSSLYDFFLSESNLTLTTSIFGQPSTLQILKFPGGISIIPFQHASIWEFPQIVFNFTLTNSISEILDNFAKFKSQLKFGLRLRSYENVYLQITNKIGSTVQPLVIVQASITSELGRITSQRLQQLAAIINTSPERNLGLDYSVFGEVKSVSLSSYPKRTSKAMPPSFSPAPAPAPGNHVEVPSGPHPLRSMRPPANHSPPHANCKSSSPNPSMVPANSPHEHSIPPISYPKSTRLIVPPANQPRVYSPRASPVESPPLLPPDLLPKPKPSFRSKSGQTNEDPSHPVHVRIKNNGS
ncbi:uncharacterized protein LOC101222031 isoform X1 [Cucumis sativus]|uniref:uncharacterized protein LOC101222031 isoform X1 n=1 Tax=Cucumis sativus TaxID=3659 RepID=UPI0005ECAA7C|nr:uncharacterized protein LOC101222031 isoform X1 [Cucumis sativus]